MNTLKEASRIEYNTASGESKTFTEIQTGCMQRIADSVEVMAKDYNRMREDRDLYKNWYHEATQRNYSLERSNAALRGVITRMKNKQKGVEVSDE